jgi:ammonium transporter Rh
VSKLPLTLAALGVSCLSFAEDVLTPSGVSQIVDAFKYMRAIHVMVMLLIGFGFLMVFVRNYGRSALTATFLLVALSLPLYMIKESLGLMSGAAVPVIDQLILAEFAAASLLICAGAVLGRIRMWQYLLLGLFFVPAYAFNEWIVLNGGLGVIPAGMVKDTGGSIVIHAFGALFGLGAIFSLTSRRTYETPIEADAVSDRFSLLGSMALWVFWPSFCAALSPLNELPTVVINVIVALCGSTLLTYGMSLILRKKIAPADIANATLAGGVAIGSTCNFADPGTAFVIGALGGTLSTFGFAVIQSRFQALIKKVDTCGVLYLHGLPGLLGGLAALFVVCGIDPAAQLTGIALTVVTALVAGLVFGKLIALTGGRNNAYEDSEEFE